MLKEGIYIADRYEIVGKIGTGGMSDVYKAKDHILGRYVAVKVLKQEFSEDVNFVTKFRSEAQSAAGLEHPNIVNIYDVGSETGIHYIVMEYIEGITLKTYIEKKGQLTYKEAVSIAVQVGRGIEAAHNKHIVHRDIKPQNIMISTDGKVKITDFGIARAVNNNTIHSDVMGSVHYTSPEQARNGFVDEKTDIYSLGIVMYEMVTGRVPFDGDSTVAVAIQHVQGEMVKPSAYAPTLPISMEKIILKCTQKSPDRRYESVSDLLVDLKKVLVSPNEDFVTMFPLTDNKTKVIKPKEVEKIKQETRNVSYVSGEDGEKEEEGFLNPKVEKAVTIMGIVAAIIIVVILGCIIANFTGVFRFMGGETQSKNPTQIENPTDEEEQNQKEEQDVASDNESQEPAVDEKVQEEYITMISIKGKTEEEAREELKTYSLGMRVIQHTASDDFESGQIISQSVEEGEQVEKHTTIDVVISTGPGEFSAPDVLGKSEETAEQMLKEAGLQPSRDYAYSNSVPEGNVISQEPEAGSSVKKGDTVVYIVSRGTEKLKVPTLTSDMDRETAEKVIQDAGFEVGSVTEENNEDVPAGNVIRQSVSAGDYMERGSMIGFVISLGKRTVYYSYTANITKPSIDALASKVELYKSESDEEISVNVTDNGDSITISATNIVDCDSGTLVITWEMKEIVGEELDEEGNPVIIEPAREILDERTVSFQQQ